MRGFTLGVGIRPEAFLKEHQVLQWSVLTQQRPWSCSLASIPVAWKRGIGRTSLLAGVSVHQQIPEQGSEEFYQLLVETQFHPAVRMVSSRSISHVQCCHTNKDSHGCLLPRCPVTYFPVCAWNPCPLCAPSIPSAKSHFTDASPEASSLVRGARVLARRETDGYYYLGHIAQEVKGSRERFVIEFDKSRARRGKVQLRLQETPLYDILHYEDARRQRLAPGDRVLAPWEARAERFGPGTVLKVVESKEEHLAHNRSGVLVNFWNGQTREVSSDKALQIPLPLSERIILEVQMPLAARQMVVDSSLHYPYIVTPGYRASGRYRLGHSDLDCWPGVCVQLIHVLSAAGGAPRSPSAAWQPGNPHGLQGAKCSREMPSSQEQAWLEKSSARK
ncbi:uncharacterized protein LOC126645265 isoform X2 [Myiozetetes cayanensis]|uniref:uncharacterized protein LOC126645265 isoform X2 n=1 Tax=Myiozetetes cayanensis TaxID=478635 RepID=UPI00215E8C2D|nr:uncharacterized protein LOC126645265 isoform X2 [Myiozetetes cayanensis]